VELHPTSSGRSDVGPAVTTIVFADHRRATYVGTPGNSGVVRGRAGSADLLAEEVALLSSLADHASISIDNAPLFSSSG
jgi:GAF domain-containing protein